MGEHKPRFSITMLPDGVMEEGNREHERVCGSDYRDGGVLFLVRGSKACQCGSKEEL